MNKKSFTLIEILVVIVIVGILSTLVLIASNSVVDSANDAKRKTSIDSLRKALLVYGTRNGGVYPIEASQCTIGSCTTLDAALSPNYFSTLPNDSTYTYVSADGTDFTLSVTMSDSTIYTYTASTGFGSGSSIPYVSTCVSGGGLTCTETTDGSYVINTFTGTGSTTWTAPNGVSEVEYLVVGGGGQGSGYVGGGGGAGGFRTATGYNVTPGLNYNVIVGGGGAAINGDANNGSDSVFDTITSTGGGGGGNYNSYAPKTGGSGGGGGAYSTTGAASSPATSPVQGYKGGNSGGNGTSGGGGGGAGGAGGNYKGGYNGGDGGIGLQSSITGIAIYYAGGGAGGWYSSGVGGTGGLGGGGNANIAGTNGLGGGGGGYGAVSGSGVGGAGGSGVVIIRYLHP